MVMSDKKIVDAIQKARESEKRNFKQSFDLAINLKSIDMKKPENKIKTEIFIPNGFGGQQKIGVIADSLVPQAKSLENIVLIRKDELETLGKNKKLAKKIANECRYFIAEAPLMPLVGKHLGPVLAVRNLMPTPVPPTATIKPMVERASKTIKIALKESPTVHCSVGSEDLDDQKIAENVDTVIKAMIAALPKGKEQIKNAVIKLTMGKPVKFEV